VFGKTFNWDDPDMMALKEWTDDTGRKVIDPRGNIYDSLPWLHRIFKAN